jgi:hypothetical protein
MSFGAWFSFIAVVVFAVALAFYIPQSETPAPVIIVAKPQRIEPPPPTSKPDTTITTEVPSAQIIWAADGIVEHVRDRRVRVVLSPGNDWSAVSIPSDVEVENIIEPEGSNFTKMYLLKFPETYLGELPVVFINNKNQKPFRIVWNPNIPQATAKPLVTTPPPQVVAPEVVPANSWSKSVDWMTSPFMV